MTTKPPKPDSGPFGWLAMIAGALVFGLAVRAIALHDKVRRRRQTDLTEFKRPRR